MIKWSPGLVNHIHRPEAMVPPFKWWGICLARAARFVCPVGATPDGRLTRTAIYRMRSTYLYFSMNMKYPRSLHRILRLNLPYGQENDIWNNANDRPFYHRLRNLYIVSNNTALPAGRRTTLQRVSILSEIYQWCQYGKLWSKIRSVWLLWSPCV